MTARFGRARAAARVRAAHRRRHRDSPIPRSRPTRSCNCPARASCGSKRGSSPRTRSSFDRRGPEAEEDTEELWLLYLRAAALRLKVDEEATILATAIAAGVRPEAELLAEAKKSLDLAKELDEQFGDLLQEAVYYSNRRILHQLYRSRFRLLRGFSGLWLIYDRQ